MWKKILLGLAGLVLLVVLGAGLYWGLNKGRLEAEYAAYKKTGAPVLMYHGVDKELPKGWPRSLVMPTKEFQAQIKYLHDEGYTMVTVKELGERLEQGLSVDKYVALSFDDGYKNNLTVALPIMQQYGAKGSFYVVNRLIGKPNYMDKEDIKKLIAADMELGSHTQSHNALGEVDEKYYVWETATSKYWLKKWFDGYIVRSLAYPNGSYNEKVLEVMRKYGFYRGLTGHIGLNTHETYKRAPLEMYRVTVADDGKGLEGFKKRLEQAYFFGFLQTKGININPLRDLLVKD